VTTINVRWDGVWLGTLRFEQPTFGAGDAWPRRRSTGDLRQVEIAAISSGGDAPRSRPAGAVT